MRLRRRKVSGAELRKPYRLQGAAGGFGRQWKGSMTPALGGHRGQLCGEGKDSRGLKEQSTRGRLWSAPAERPRGREQAGTGGKGRDRGDHS